MSSNLDPYYLQLTAISPKAARAYQSIGEELRTALPPQVFDAWFQLGSIISYNSSASGIRYFNESGDLILHIASHSSLIFLLQKGFQLGCSKNSVALDYFRQLSSLIEQYPQEIISQWADIGKQIAEQDYLTGSEYFRSGPAILKVLGPPLLEPWARIGLLLSQEDALRKSFLTLEYFRTSPELFGQVREISLYPQILSIGHALALQMPKETLPYIKIIPDIFRNLRQEEGIELIFSLAAELAFQAPIAVVDFLTHATDLLKMMNGNLNSLKHFVETGAQLKASPDAIRSFFSLKSKKAILTIQELSHVIFLSEIRKRLVYYAEMITGRPVEIIPGTIPSSSVKKGIGTILLPEKINSYKDKKHNFRLYKMMLLHEAAHIEFGSYEPLSREALEEVASRFAGTPSGAEPGHPVWHYFPDPVLAQNLWTIAEESRIDFLLRSEYPGAVKDLYPIFQSQKNVRPDLFNLPEEKGVMEALFQLSMHEDIVVPLPIANLVSAIFTILKTLWHRGSSNQDTLRTVCLIYEKIQNELKQSPGEKVKPDLIRPEEVIPNYGVIPESAFSHHGLITPEFLLKSGSATPEALLNPKGSDREQPSTGQSQRSDTHAHATDRPESPPLVLPESDPTGFHYPEWDWMIQDYKPSWCRVIEKRVDSSQKTFTGSGSSHGALLSLRRYFERLRPDNYRKMRKESEGEELDFDRLIDLVTDIRAGIAPPENFYIRRARKERLISVAILIDLSGSTGQIIPGTKKRIIDVEKESLNLMVETLDTIGDDYGIYGFSGQSRNSVEFYLIKDFDVKSESLIHEKLGSVEPLGQNRDGAAIRHLSEKLYRRESKTKLLMIMSDGKPLDDDYADLYALEDTKQALREAKQRGIHPFCITVDRESNDYIRKMYQEVNYTYISDIETLPLKLPQIYKKLTT